MMRARSHTADRGDAGFTLLELVAVIAILALATTLAMPAAQRSRQSADVRTAAAGLGSALRMARAEAMRTNREARLTLDSGRRRFIADGMSAALPLPKTAAITVSVPTTEQTGEDVSVIRFRPDGGSSGGSITLAGPRQSARLTVDWLTGRTAVSWGSP